MASQTSDGGAFDTFMREFGSLYSYASAPSERELAQRAKAAGRSISRTTIAEALHGHRLPRWDVVQVLVELLQGDLDEFEKLWLAAKAQITNDIHPNRHSHSIPESVPPLPSTSPKPGGTPTTAPAPRSRASVSGGGKVGKTVERRAPWRVDFDIAVAPPVIQLMVAAIRDGLDPVTLLFDIARHDPRGAAPAITMIAENDLFRAADIIATVSTTQSLPVLLLSDILVTSPTRAAALVHLLFDRHKLDPLSLINPAVRLCGLADAHRPLARRILFEAIGGDVEQVAIALIDLAHGTPQNVAALVSALEATFVDAVTGDRAGHLLGWLAKNAPSLTVEVFFRMVSGPNGRARRGTGDRTVIGMIAERYPQSGALLCAGALAQTKPRGAEPSRLGRLLADLAEESMPLAARILTPLATRAPRTSMLTLSKIADTDQIAGLLLLLAAADAHRSGRIVAEWLDMRYPHIDVPVGWVVQSMAESSPAITVDVLCAASIIWSAAQRGASPPPLAGLERMSSRNLGELLEIHIKREQFRLVRPLLGSTVRW